MEYTRIHNKAIELFNLNPRKATPKGWIMTASSCPFCGKDNYHLGIKLNPPGASNELSFNCFKCGSSGGEYVLFREMGLESFVRDGDYVRHGRQLENTLKKSNEEEELDLEVIDRHPPLGWRRKFQDDYLDERGFEDWQYQLYKVGRTKLTRKLKDYVIFLIEEDGKNKGYIARHVWSKEQIKEHEQKTGQKIIRYRNEGGVDFDKLLFGYEEIDSEVKTVILVEGVFDKTNVDKLLALNKADDTVCCCTFGKAISEHQLAKLRMKQVTNVILLYDPDAINDSKRIGYRLEKVFDTVKIGFLEEKDPGDLNLKEFNDVMKNLQNPFKFAMSKLQKHDLK